MKFAFFTWLYLTVSVSSASNLSSETIRKVRAILGRSHENICVSILENARRKLWNMEYMQDHLATRSNNLREINVDFVFYIFEMRASKLDMLVTDYIDFLYNPKGSQTLPVASSIRRQELEFIGSIRETSIAAADMSFPLDLQDAAFMGVHEKLFKLFDQNFAATEDRYIRVFGLGENFADLDIVIQLVEAQAHYRRMSPVQFCEKYRLRFAFYDISPEVLSAATATLERRFALAPWLQGRTQFRYINLTMAELYMHMEKNTTLLTFSRNNFRDQLMRKGGEIINQFRRIATPNGWLITDLWQEWQDKIPLKRLMQAETIRYRDTRDSDDGATIWQNADPE